MAQAIAYTIEQNPTPQEVAEVFRSSGINRPADDLDRIGRMIGNSNLIACARDGGRLVGIARAVTDFSYCCYLSDLAVASGCQGRGIGKKLIEMVRGQLTDEVTLLLLSSPEAMSYYPHIGFEKIDNGWRILRKR